jgi:hypothetical protein
MQVTVSLSLRKESAAMRAISRALVCLLALGFPVLAQEATDDATDDATTGRVSATTEAFLDQIVAEDFAAERAFLSPKLASSISSEQWAEVRRQTTRMIGKTPRYAVHGISYYDQGGLLAAVDFSGTAEVPETLVCGFLLWEVPETGALGLLRFEQNVIPVAAFRQMPVQEAAQMMVNWRCPTALVESTLNVKLE